MTKVMTIDDALERIAELEAALGDGLHAPPEWGLSHQDNRFLGALLQRSFVSNESLKIILSKDGGIPISHGSLKVTAYRVRKKVCDHGIKIVCHHGSGYSMPHHSKTLLRCHAAKGAGLLSELMEAQRLTDDLKKLITRLRAVTGRLGCALATAEQTLIESNQFIQTVQEAHIAA